MQEVIKVDPRVRRTRQELQRAMNELLGEKDFPDITIQDIAERAALNRGTFYKHFLDKDDLLTTTIRERFQTLLHERLGQNSRLSADNLKTLIQITYDCMISFRIQCRRSRVRNEYSTLMRETQQQIEVLLFDWLQHASSDRDPQSPKLVAAAISWMICGSITPLTLEARELPKVDQFSQIAELAQAALAKYLADD